MISRKTYCRALKLLQTQENFAAESRQILLTLLRDSIDDVCDYGLWNGPYALRRMLAYRKATGGADVYGRILASAGRDRL